MDLKWLQGKTGYIESRYALIPVYRLSGQEIVLFDSGVETDPALLELLEREGLRVRAVLSTHLHWDHIANNEALVARHGAEILAHPSEIPFFRNLCGEPYSVTGIEGDTVEIDGISFKILYTPGHSCGHLAYATPDGVCCLGDVIMSQDELDRSKIPFMNDVDRAIVSMEDIRQTRYPFYIVAHKGVVPQAKLANIVERNIQKELDLYDLLRQQIKAPTAIEQVISDFIRAAGVRSEKMVEVDFVRHTARVRILALANVGEFSIEGDLVIPR